MGKLWSWAGYKAGKTPYPGDIKYVKKFETLADLRFERAMHRGTTDTPLNRHDERTAHLVKLWKEYVEEVV
jgi:hypothetical protein